MKLSTTTPVRLRTLSKGQRVKVVDVVREGHRFGGTEDRITVNAFGTVARVCSYGAAWVTLDTRSKVSAVHPFPIGDERSAHVLAYPEDCEAAVGTPTAGNRKERRANKAEAAKALSDTSVGPPTIAIFAKDHWSVFAYIETRCVDYYGVPDRRHLRCIPGRHIAQAHEGGDSSNYPTRMKDGLVLHNHDDWDCLEDLEREGLLVNEGTAVNPEFRLTPLGWDVAKQLRAHKSKGGNFANFVPDGCGPEVPELRSEDA